MCYHVLALMVFVFLSSASAHASDPLPPGGVGCEIVFTADPIQSPDVLYDFIDGDGGGTLETWSASYDFLGLARVSGQAPEDQTLMLSISTGLRRYKCTLAVVHSGSSVMRGYAEARIREVIQGEWLNLLGIMEHECKIVAKSNVLAEECEAHEHVAFGIQSAIDQARHTWTISGGLLRRFIEFGVSFSFETGGGEGTNAGSLNRTVEDQESNDVATAFTNLETSGQVIQISGSVRGLEDLIGSGNLRTERLHSRAKIRQTCGHGPDVSWIVYKSYDDRVRRENGGGSWANGIGAGGYTDPSQGGDPTSGWFQ